MNIIPRPSMGILLILSCLSVSLTAEENNPVELGQITVTAKPLGKTGLQIAQPVQVLSGEELAYEKAASLGETLASQPGISSADFGQAASSPVIRGLSGLRVRLLEGGIGSMDVSATSADHVVSIEPMTAQQIEVLKGPSTLLYGSGAIGGIVNVVDNRIPEYVPDELEADLTLRHNSADNQALSSLDLTTGSGDFALHLDGTWRDTEDYDTRHGFVENSDSRAFNHAIGASWLGTDNMLGVSFSEYRSEYGIPAEDARIDMEQQRYDVKARYQPNVPGLKQISFRMGFNNYQHAEIEASGEIASLFENDAYEGRLEFMHQPVADWSGVFGLQFSARDFSAIGEESFLAPVETDNLAVFVVEEHAWGKHQLSLGARYEYQDHNPAQGLSGVGHSLVSVSAEMVWALGDAHLAALSISRSQRAPAAEELYADGPHLATQTFERGNEQLEEETANNLDLSLRHTGTGWQWNLNLFVNFIEDFIFQQSLDENADGIADRLTDDGVLSNSEDDLLSVSTTQANALFYGVEFETSNTLFENQHGQLNARFFFDSVRGRLSSGESLPRITPARIGAGLRYQRGDWLARLDLMQVLRQKNTAALETETASYSMLDGAVSKKIETEVMTYTFSLKGKNLLNQNARRHTSFLKDNAPLPGRSVGLELRMRY